MASLFNHYEGDTDPRINNDEFDFRVRLDSETDDLYNGVSDEDIRKMLETLAPQMSELEDVLKDISAADDDLTSALDLAKSTSKSLREEDDEDLDHEIEHLAMSAQALREELEFAQDINLLLTPSKEEEDNQEGNFEHAHTPVDTPVTFMSPQRQERKAPEAYTLQDHAEHLGLRTEKMGGWYYCDMSRFLQPDTEAECQDLVKDYALPIPFRKLKRLYSGIVYHHVQSIKAPKELSTPARMFASPPPKPLGSSNATPVKVRPIQQSSHSTPDASGVTESLPSQAPVHQEEPLPVRTVAIRIRPDVLVGAVMDSIHHAFEVLPRNCVSHILKRQGGHFRAAVYVTSKALAYVADAQLCTQKNDDLERRLVIRFYHIQDDPEAMQELGQVLHQTKSMQDRKNPGSLSLLEAGSTSIADEHMKQACSLIQRLMAAQQQGGAGKMEPKHQMSWLGLKGNAFATEDALKNAVGVHLESNYKPCPSVREENKKATPTIRKLTLPSLSEKDFPLMHISWELTSCVMEELDTRDCSYNTLATLAFGRFPALNSLDIHYCSQLRRLSRESMINNLLRSAKDLEDYAKGAEYSCAVCIALLQPMLSRYGMAPLDLPQAFKSLQEYPLNFTSPQAACPPWGQLVLEADNQIQAKTPTGDIDPDTAVKLVYDAFTKQDDDEQAARLGRKNAQIMDRLAILQSHQRALVQTLKDAYVVSEKAAKEATIFLKYARNAVNEGRPGHPGSITPEVPLLTFTISHGASSSGTCFVSASQMLFVSSYIPLVGSKRSTLFDLDQVRFQVDESVPPSLLNPFPNTVNVVLNNNNEILLRFRPAISPVRLGKLLAVIKAFTQPSEFSQGLDTIDAVEQNGEIRLVDDHNDDQISV